MGLTFVQGQQYVCAGELVAIQTLTNVLNYLKVHKVDICQGAPRVYFSPAACMLTCTS
jgi:hypothetical protein